MSAGTNKGYIKMNEKHTGLFHIYCGDGKGKTTAAIGAAVRAAGAGLKVCFVQLMKSGESSELSVIKNIQNITVQAVINPYGFTWKMTVTEKEKLRKLNDETVEMLINAIGNKSDASDGNLSNSSQPDNIALGKFTYNEVDGWFDMIVIDELMSAYQNELVGKSLVFSLIEKCKGNTELIFTGRNPSDELMEKADYITEMKCQRHPYEKGVSARLGIEL